jgi:hypothetical protein
MKTPVWLETQFWPICCAVAAFDPMQTEIATRTDNFETLMLGKPIALPPKSKAKSKDYKVIGIVGEASDFGRGAGEQATLPNYCGVQATLRASLAR